MEELVTALSQPAAYEFKALFLVVHAALRARDAASGGEEMLRLRAYEKLQNMVRRGQVKKSGKSYKGLCKPLRLLAEDLKSQRDQSSARAKPPSGHKADSKAKRPQPAHARPR